MKDISLGHSITISPDVVFRELDNEAVILNLESGTYFGLNEIGTKIWQLIDEYSSLRDVFDHLHSEYDVEVSRLEADLLELARQLQAKGLVRVSDA